MRTPVWHGPLIRACHAHDSILPVSSQEDLVACHNGQAHVHQTGSAACMRGRHGCAAAAAAVPAPQP